MKALAASLIIIVCFCFMSCGGSDENSTASSPTTNAIPLIVPDNTTVPGPAIDTTTTVFNMWVLDSINAKAPDSNYFAHGSPYLVFDSVNKTINGFMGCNGITGKLKVNGQRLSFDSLNVSSQACRGKGQEFERKLLAGFKSGKTTYKIQNGMLHLNPGGGSNFIFRKIRR